MPYESDDAAQDEYSSVLADVMAIADQFDDHSLILGGDFNVDLSKHKSHSKLLLDMCTSNNLRMANMHDRCTVDFTYIFNLSRFSFIDHFFLSAAVYETCVASYSVKQ